ncbi:hypothetical protein JAAARDRAFT_35657 [Jaapia argillacea MUCL 33604]|uniref:Galactose oxidase n=1 Tax=Jaapia argillacea MUCL 33604 TaxID=933084 RepID=A0A067PT78_9AGAM|nr:hypothetical protein JAAARDRAFT_35657 [Jaapia argillacea MUCL 33604]
MSLPAYPRLVPLLCSVWFLLDHVASAYTAIPRWGQAVAVVDDVLFVHGGRTDQYNSYSYTSAPVTNDLLYLQLSNAFDPSSPPWTYVGGSANTSLNQGPAVAWHILSAFDTDDLLLLGGDPGPNSPTVILDRADSAYLLDIYNRLDPSWTSEVQLWANEPTRRIFFAASSSGGKIWVTGGLKDDGSGTALSDHYVFDPSVPSFTLLPSANGPPDIYGHTSIVLSNGWLLVLGGYCQSEATLITFDRIWVLDTTQSNLSWTMLVISTSNLPSPRRGFAATLLDGDRILIHGGSDAVLQNTYSDGWILDTTQNPAVWSSVPALSAVGARRDHFAVCCGSEVLFGFGYESAGPAPAGLQVYDYSSSAFQPSFTPMPTYTYTTIGPPSQSGGANAPAGTAHTSGHPPTGTHASTRIGSGTLGPTATSPSGSSGPGQVSNQDGQDKNHVVAITLAAVFGVFGLIAGAGATAYYFKRRRNSRDAFHLLGGDDGEEESPQLVGSGHLEKARMAHENLGKDRNILSRFGLGGAVGTVPPPGERRDMLADEDTREFGSVYPWRRQVSGSGRSSRSSIRNERPRFGEIMQGSWASLRSVGALLGSSVRGRASREPSWVASREPSGSARSLPWGEKEELLFEPLSDASLIRIGDPTPSKPQNRRQISTASAWSYVDPFADQDIEALHDTGMDDDDLEAALATGPPHPLLKTSGLPPSVGPHPLSPLTEQSSRLTLTDPSSSRSSHELPASLSESVRNTTSQTSHDQPRSPSLRPTSIIDANPAPAPLRRSDSWWARFAKSSFLDRRHSEGSKSPRNPRNVLEFRDPNPAPRLLTIEESMHSLPPESPESQHAPQHSRGETYSSRLARSMSSLRTTRTADTDALERIAGNADVVQRMGSHVTSPSSTTTTSESPGREASWSASASRPLSMVVASGESDDAHDHVVQSPIEMADLDKINHPPSSDPSTPSTPSRTNPAQPLSPGTVASRVQAFERRMSMDADASRPPPAINTRHREERLPRTHKGVNYGLVQRPSLFVANPDHKQGSSSDG